MTRWRAVAEGVEHPHDPRLRLLAQIAHLVRNRIEPPRARDTTADGPSHPLQVARRGDDEGAAWRRSEKSWDRPRDERFAGADSPAGHQHWKVGVHHPRATSR